MKKSLNLGQQFNVLRLRTKPLILWYLTNKIYDASLPSIRYVTRSQLKHVLMQFSSIKRSEEMQLWNVSSWEFVKYMMTNNNFIIGAIWQTFKKPSGNALDMFCSKTLNTDSSFQRHPPGVSPPHMMQEAALQRRKVRAWDTVLLSCHECQIRPTKVLALPWKWTCQDDSN